MKQVFTILLVVLVSVIAGCERWKHELTDPKPKDATQFNEDKGIEYTYQPNINVPPKDGE